jgi:hypothetical protein
MIAQSAELMQVGIVLRNSRLVKLSVQWVIIAQEAWKQKQFRVLMAHTRKLMCELLFQRVHIVILDIIVPMELRLHALQVRCQHMASRHV